MYNIMVDRVVTCFNALFVMTLRFHSVLVLVEIVIFRCHVISITYLIAIHILLQIDSQLYLKCTYFFGVFTVNVSYR